MSFLVISLNFDKSLYANGQILVVINGQILKN